MITPYSNIISVTTLMLPIIKAYPVPNGEKPYIGLIITTPNLTAFITSNTLNTLKKHLGEPIEFDVTFPELPYMKLPITFEQFKSDPLKALFFAALVAMTALYVDSRNQMAKATEVCEKRLQMCEAKLDKLTKQLKTQDSLCSALVTEITIYKSLGKI
jgi:hypothetical protein